MIDDIDPNSKTIEMSAGTGSIGIVTEGKDKGTCFIKDKNGIRIISYIPNDLRKAYDKIMKKDA
jgi:hypothetical protein